ncbi:hypothetical protein WJX81_006227 [Elliptochloris bilobata]|uniref:Protein kinase domain-containing protein n=1 Tax=Elliptochloris bilobata TaxID=381761 RepID=A0AAW1RJH1_9CHLO
MQDTLDACCKTCHIRHIWMGAHAEILNSCVWQWCRKPQGCQTASGNVPHRTCMTSRREAFPAEWQNCTAVSGLHMMPGADGVRVPNYRVTPGRYFTPGMSSWDLGPGLCPAHYWVPSTSHCNVTADLPAVAAACNAQPACQGFVFAAPVQNQSGAFGILKRGQMDRYCLKPIPRAAAYSRLNADGSPYGPAAIPPEPLPDAQRREARQSGARPFPVQYLAIFLAGAVALAAPGFLACCWCAALRRAHDAERAAAKLEADSLERGFSGGPPSKKDSISSASQCQPDSLGSTLCGLLPSPHSGHAHVSLMAVMDRVGTGAAHASPVKSVLMELPWNDWEIGPCEIEVLQREDGADWKLGEGASGSVFKALRGGQVVAVKIFHQRSGRSSYSSLPAAQHTARCRDDLRREISLLRSLHDRNIVNFVGAAIWDGVAVLVTDYMERGDLYQALAADGDRRFSWHCRRSRAGQVVPNTGLARSIALDVARGLHYLHSRSPKVVHFDLKSPNILLARDYTAKLADVGLAKLMMRDCLSTLRDIGTFAWAAPEALLGHKCTEKVDIYSFGVILWELSTGEAPCSRQLRGLQVPDEAPPEVDAVIKSCLTAQPGARPSALELVGFLERWAPACQMQAIVPPTKQLEDSYALPGKSAHESVPHMWSALADKHSDQLAVIDPHRKPSIKLTYRELHSQMTQFAAGLQALGLETGDRVALFSENGARWLVADQGIMMVGAADAVRGSTSPPDELAYILRHSGAVAVICQDSPALEKLLPALAQLDAQRAAESSGAGEYGANANGASANGASGDVPPGGLRFAAVLWGQVSDKCRFGLDCPALEFTEVMARGRRGFTPVPLQPSDLATLVYTSGTTGKPKGVMLTHANLVYQVANLSFFLRPAPGERTLSLLPPWHIYERAASYFCFACGVTQVYTNIRRFKEDLTRYPPHFFICVPLVLDTLYNRVRATIKAGSRMKRAVAGVLLNASLTHVRARRLADGLDLRYARQVPPALAVMWAVAVAAASYPLHRLAQVVIFHKIRAALGIMKCVVSGGGSLAAHLDDFYEAAGLPVLNGWGLTETSPVLACRRLRAGENVRGSVGLPMPGTQVRVVHPETRADLPDGEQGVMLVRGPGVMKGYYADEAATAAAFLGDGWFDTGDLGWRAPMGVAGSAVGGHLVLAGRAKDTIVLSSGENIEPATLEDLVAASPFVAHAVVVGQDRRALGVLIVPAEEAFAELASMRGGELGEEEQRAVIRAEISKALAGRPCQDGIAAFALLSRPFSAEDGTLTRTLKPRRGAIFARYARELSQLMAELR